MATHELLSSPFREQLESLHRDTNLQLVGSIGRGTILSSYGHSDALPPVLRPNGEYRDIDVLDHTGIQGEVPELARGPLSLDFETNKWVRHESNGMWIVFPGDHSVAESVRPEVFEPVERQIGEVACRTYSVTTQQQINRMAVFERPKDKQPLREYDEFVESLTNAAEAADGDVSTPAEFYEPFARLSQGIREKHPSYFWACRVGVVVNSLPSPLRDAAKRLAVPARRRYLA